MTRRSERELEHAVEQLRERFGLANEDNGVDTVPPFTVVHRDGETGELTVDGEPIDRLDEVDGRPFVVEREVVPTVGEGDT